MKIDAHIEELRRKHQSLSSTIEAEERSLSSDDQHVRSLKRQKLRLKEEISRLALDA